MRLLGIGLAMLLSTTAFGNDFFTDSDHSTAVVVTGTKATTSAATRDGYQTSVANTTKAKRTANGLIGPNGEKFTETLKHFEFAPALGTKKAKRGSKALGDDCTTLNESDLDCTLMTTDNGTSDTHHYWANGVELTNDGAKGAGYSSKARAGAQKYLDANGSSSSVDACFKASNDNCDTAFNTRGASEAQGAACTAFRVAAQKALDKGWSNADAKASVLAFAWNTAHFDDASTDAPVYNDTNFGAYSCRCTDNGTTVSCTGWGSSR